VRQGKAEAVSLLGEARQDSKCSRLLVKCDNRPETVNMKISNEDGVSVTVFLDFVVQCKQVKNSKVMCTVIQIQNINCS